MRIREPLGNTAHSAVRGDPGDGSTVLLDREKVSRTTEEKTARSGQPGREHRVSHPGTRPDLRTGLATWSPSDDEGDQNKDRQSEENSVRGKRTSRGKH